MKLTESTHIKATVSAKGQVVIPRALREQLGIHAGTELIFTRHNDVLEIKPIKRTISMLFGCCKDESDELMSVADMDEAIAHAVLPSDDKKGKRKKKLRRKA